PNQWCPVVQPGVAPGSPPRELPLDVVVTVHRQTGFAEELQAGGVTNRVPVYDAGVPYASGRAIVVQRPVGTVPVVPVEAIGPANQAVRGQVQLIGADGGWRSVGYDGRYRAVEVASGDLRVLTLDLAAPQIAAVTADDPVAWVSKDLAAWLGGDPGSLFGLVAWGRSEFHPPVAASFAPVARGGAQWSVAGTDRLEVGVTRDGDRIRVAIAWRAAPWRGSSADPVAQKAALAASVE
ncbi:MAG: hypothetical protein ABMB14_16815, partial [Myxococcota bacterium]